MGKKSVELYLPVAYSNVGGTVETIVENSDTRSPLRDDPRTREARGPEKHTKNPPWPENHTKIADPQNHTKNGDNGLKNTLANNAYSTVLPRVLLVLQ